MDGLDFCSVCGGDHHHRAHTTPCRKCEKIHDPDEWCDAVRCDICLVRYDAKGQRDPDCVGCGSYADDGE